MKILPSSTDGVYTRQLPDGTSVKSPMSKPDVRARVVCVSDNNGWMSRRLEVPMKRATEDILIHNKQKTFSPDDCMTIATWAFKTTLLANHMSMPGEPFFSKEQRHDFARDLTIPKGVHIWLARRNAGHLTTLFRSRQNSMQPYTPPAPHLINMPVSRYRFDSYDCLFTVGYLMLQVFAAKWTNPQAADYQVFPLITHDLSYREYSIQIWPKSGLSVDWPPPQAIGNELLEGFWNRTHRLTLPAWMK